MERERSRGPGDRSFAPGAVQLLARTAGAILPTYPAEMVKTTSSAIRSRFLPSLLAMALGLGVLATPVASGQSTRVDVSPSSVDIGPGESAVISFSLDEPIIAPPPDPGFVTITFTTSDPGRIELSTTSLTWTAAEWQQTRQLTIASPGEAPGAGDVLVTVTGQVTSNSEYYSGVTASIEVTVSGAEPEPSEPTTTAPAPSSTTSTTSPPSDPPTEAERSASGRGVAAGLAITG